MAIMTPTKFPNKSGNSKLLLGTKYCNSSSKIDKNIDDFINELIDTVIEELKVGKNFNFAESKLLNLIETDKVKEFQKILPQTLFDPDFIFIQRKILGFLLFFKSINASIPILSIIKEYDKKLQIR